MRSKGSAWEAFPVRLGQRQRGRNRRGRPGQTLVAVDAAMAFQDDVSIDPGDPECADRSPVGTFIVRGPRRLFRNHLHRQLVPIDVPVRFPEVELLRDDRRGVSPIRS